MRTILIGVLLCSTPKIYALNLCPLYHKIYISDVEPKIRTGIPFKLLSIAAGTDLTWKRIVSVRFDLWNDQVVMEIPGGEVHKVAISSAEKELCRMLSLPEVPPGKSVFYRLLLNPTLDGDLSSMTHKGRSSFGFLNINWQRVVAGLQTERILMESELTP